MKKSVEIQALLFKADSYSKADAAKWCRDHDFDDSDYFLYERDGEDVEHIFMQFSGDDSSIDPDTWAIMIDDFPDGIRARTCVRNKSMDKRFTKGTQSADDPFTFVMSDETIDRMGDIIKADGWVLKHFRNNPIALWGHSHVKPIGLWKNVKVVGKQLVGTLKLAAEGTSEEIDVIRRLLEQRILKAVSVGFTPLDYERREGDDFGYVFKKCELNECSLVSVPANPNAIAVAKGLGADDSVLERIFKDYHSEGPSVPVSGGNGSAPAVPKSTKRQSPSGATSLTPNTRNIPVKDLATRIATKRDRLVSIKDQVTGLKANLDENDSLSDDDSTMLDALCDEETTVLKDITTLEKMEQALAVKAAPVSSNVIVTGGVPVIAGKKERPGSLLVKMAATKLIAYLTGKSFSDTLADMYDSDERVKAIAPLFTKTAVNPAMTTTQGWAAELVADDLQGFLNELAPISIYGALLQYAWPLNFNNNGSITVPSRSGAAIDDVAGSWVGEGGVIPVKQLSLTSQTLYRYKVGVISAFSNEILDQSVPSIETIVRQAILDDTSVAIDSALVDDSPMVPGIRPPGLRDGITLTPSAGDTADDIITDLKVLFSAMSTSRVGVNPVLIMNSNRLLGLSTVTTAAGGFMFRDEISQGTLLGVPVIHSTTMPADIVLIMDAGSFAAANDTPEFMISDQTVLTMANADATAPTQAEGEAGAVGTAEQVPPQGGIHVNEDPAQAFAAGYQAVSMYQTYSTALRMVLPTSWGLVRTDSVAGLSGVSW